ncbi:MAG: hypothetical protein ABIQ58_08915 [Candidatus Limnocylindrales bacterium]
MPGLIDRQQWKAAIEDEAERQERYGRPCAVILAELDGMDGRGGPGAANWLMPPFAGLLVSLTRASDRITRLTNARLGILLLETDPGGAARFVSRTTVATESWLAANPWRARLVVGWAGATSAEELRHAVRTAETHLSTRRT